MIESTLSTIQNSPQQAVQPSSLQTASPSNEIDNSLGNKENVEVTNQIENKTVAEYLKENFPQITPEEIDIYEQAGLKIEVTDGRVCLNSTKIDLNYKDALGRTNLERMKQGLAPLDSETGLPYELHHVGQANDGPLAELTHQQHMTPPNNLTLHRIRNGSEVDHGASWDQLRSEHWKARAEQLEQQLNAGA